MAESPTPAAAARSHRSVVLSHHWLVRRRGGEKVLEAIADLFRDAPIYTLVADRAALAQTPLARRTIVTSVLQRIPGAARHYPKLLPLMPWAARRLRLPAADLVICSDAAIAKAFTPAAGSRVVCYCHSPMRYVWEREISEQYARSLPRLLRPLWPGLCRRVARADRAAAERVDVFIANSQHVAARIQRCYGREARVVYPPVELTGDGESSVARGRNYLCVGHHVPYKRLDLAVEACRGLGRRLVVIGDGPEVARLRRSGDGVEWLGFQPDDVVLAQMKSARGLIFPGEEDFGIVPVEAMAAGCPVIAFGVGGAAESVIDGRTGVLFDRQDGESLVAALRRFESLTFDEAALHARAREFSLERFRAEFLDAIGP
jgi:glycosyltransferase involved in cell wall biosynthesis